MNFSDALGHWDSFALLTGTAGATLAGLTFVAVTAANRLVQGSSVTQLRVHIDPSLLAFTLALLLSCVLLLPTLTSTALVLTLEVSGLLYGGYMVFVLRQLLKYRLVRQYDRLDWVFYLVVPFMNSALLLLAGVLCLWGATETALTLAALGLVALLLMGIRNALDVLMVTLNYEAQTPEAPPDIPPPPDTDRTPHA